MVLLAASRRTEHDNITQLYGKVQLSALEGKRNGTRRQMSAAIQQIKEFLSQTPLFHGLPEEALATISDLAHIKRFSRYETIFHEGSPADGFYIVLSGKVKVFKLSPDGKEQILHIFGPGHPFGEVAVFANVGFPASAQALGQTEVVFISKQEFTVLLKQDITIAMNMLAILSRRLRIFVRMIEDLSLKEVPGRLATYLIIESQVQGRGGEVQLEISKAQLASLLGTIPETLSRIFKRLQDQGMIRVQGSKITIEDMEALEELSGILDLDEIHH